MMNSKKIIAFGLGLAMTAGLAASVSAGDEPRTIKIGTWYDHYYDSTHTDIYDDPSVADEELAQKHFDVVKEVEEKYNVKLEFVNLTYDGIQESINTSILAGTPDCDIYEVDMTFGIPAALNGFVTNLEEVLPADSDLFNDQMVFSPYLPRSPPREKFCQPALV